MKLKRNSLTTLLVVSFLLMALSGCGQQAEPDSAQPPLETVTYSNLTDADSRKLLNEALADANVDETRTKLLLDRVDQFNASVKSEWLTGGFESAAPTETRYDPYEMQDLWTEKNGSFPGYNCRITAFSLFGEFVTAGVDQPETQGEDSLFMDLETLGRRSRRSLRRQHVQVLRIVCTGNCRRYHGGGGSGQSASGGLVGARDFL